MDITKKYQEAIKEIDIYKEQEFKSGMTTICKKKIDVYYNEFSEYQTELELELYERKAFLMSCKNYINGINYDMIMCILGAFFGTVFAIMLEDILQAINGFVVDIINGAIWNRAPMDIIYGDSNKWIIIFAVFVTGSIILLFVYKTYMVPNNAKKVFLADMSEYEQKRIDEILKKL